MYLLVCFTALLLKTYLYHNMKQFRIRATFFRDYLKPPDKGTSATQWLGTMILITEVQRALTVNLSISETDRPCHKQNQTWLRELVTAVVSFPKYLWAKKTIEEDIPEQTEQFTRLTAILLLFSSTAYTLILLHDPFFFFLHKNLQSIRTLDKSTG